LQSFFSVKTESPASPRAGRQIQRVSPACFPPPFSKAWKFSRGFFQALEKNRQIFPMLGKATDPRFQCLDKPARLPGGRHRYLAIRSHRAKAAAGRQRSTQTQREIRRPQRKMQLCAFAFSSASAN
jgi:hypothetical protein